MSLVYERARDAYRALCELEDALDAAGKTTTERESNDLQTVVRRWEHDTLWKIRRQLDRRPA